jgi:glycerol uptake facilitator-like aquaporin
MKPSALLAEFIGTFALVFTIFLTIHNLGTNPTGLLSVALAVGFIVMTFGTAFGPISGGHFNPCVTIAMMIAGKLSILSGILYWVVQAIGGIAAVFAAAYLLAPNGQDAMVNISLSRGPQIELMGSMLAEAIAAFFFVTVVFMTAVHRKAPPNGALYLGFALTTGILAIGPISGGAINPAVGLALSVGSANWENLLSWSVGPMIGAILAALLYIAIWDREDAVPVPASVSE